MLGEQVLSAYAKTTPAESYRSKVSEKLPFISVYVNMLMPFAELAVSVM